MVRMRVAGLSLVAGLCASCAAPKFNEQQHGPTVADLAGRVRCELLELAQDKENLELQVGDYGFSAQLSLTVNASGSIAPNFQGTFPVTGGNFLLLGGFTVSKTREDNMFVFVSYSLQDLRNALKQRPDSMQHCDRLKARLGGELGIKDKVLAALTVANRDQTSKSGEFGGSVSFVLTRKLDAVGPRWVLEQFTGPGGFVGLGSSNTNKITFALAQGTVKSGEDPTGTVRARQLLSEALLDERR